MEKFEFPEDIPQVGQQIRIRFPTKSGFNVIETLIMSRQTHSPDKYLTIFTVCGLENSLPEDLINTESKLILAYNSSEKKWLIIIYRDKDDFEILAEPEVAIV